MAGCCAPRGYDAFFDARRARKDARRYRRRGVDRTAQRLVGYLRDRGLEGSTALEIGGGVGAIQIELLKAGAARTTNIEISPAYEDEAAKLIEEAGLEGRVERRVADFVAAAEEVQEADAVVMHRVVCCYPDAARLVGAAARHARRSLLLTFPPDTAIARVAARLVNVFCSFRGTDFRVYIHPHGTILGAARAEGLEPVLTGRSRIWLYTALERR